MKYLMMIAMALCLMSCGKVGYTDAVEEKGELYLQNNGFSNSVIYSIDSPVEHDYTYCGNYESLYLFEDENHIGLVCLPDSYHDNLTPHILGVKKRGNP